MHIANVVCMLYTYFDYHMDIATVVDIATAIRILTLLYAYCECCIYNVATVGTVWLLYVQCGY